MQAGSFRLGVSAPVAALGSGKKGGGGGGGVFPLQHRWTGTSKRKVNIRFLEVRYIVENCPSLA